MTEISAAALAALKDAVGPQGWIDEPEALVPHLTEWRGLYTGSTPLLQSSGCVTAIHASM